MIRDTYEQQWKAVRGTWRQLNANLARAKREADSFEDWASYIREMWAENPEVGEARIRHERADRARRAAERAVKAARDRELNKLLSSVEPVNDWIGAAWVDPRGNLYPVRYGNHCGRAEQIVPHLFKAEYDSAYERDGYLDCGHFLSNQGWLRIGADGLVGDHNWNRVNKLETAQFDAIWAMHERAKLHGANDWRETNGFASGLYLSIRYTLGEVDESGRTPEEVRRDHERYEHMQRRWAREDAEFYAKRERERETADIFGW